MQLQKIETKIYEASGLYFIKNFQRRCLIKSLLPFRVSNVLLPKAEFRSANDSLHFISLLRLSKNSAFPRRLPIRKVESLAKWDSAYACNLLKTFNGNV